MFGPDSKVVKDAAIPASFSQPSRSATNIGDVPSTGM